MPTRQPDIQPGSTDGVRLAEVVAALSLASDLGIGQPLEHQLRTCLLAVRIGDALKLGEAELRETYYVALLRRVGCTGDSHELAAWFSDELAARARAEQFDLARPLQVFLDVARHVGEGRPPLLRVASVLGALSHPGQARQFVRASCEVASRLARRLGLGPAVAQGVAEVFERWDGRGWPDGKRGEEISRPARIVRLAAMAEITYRLGGAPAVAAMAKRESGRSHDPEAARILADRAVALLVEEESVWSTVIRLEPGPRPILHGRQFDDALSVVADFADLLTPTLRGHSRTVATLAAQTARVARLSEAEAELVGRAGLVHDLGRIAIPAAIWQRPGSLTDAEWERVRLHPYYTERLLVQSEPLARLARVASYHHERLDGSGYHRGVRGAEQTRLARLLAVCDVFAALQEARPHRPALGVDEAVADLRRQVRAGRLDGDSVEAVVATSSGRTVRRRTWPAGLTDREVEVLRLVTRGLTDRQVASRLVVSPRTVNHHVQHIYDKLGISTRAAAAVFALQHRLLDEAWLEE